MVLADSLGVTVGVVGVVDGVLLTGSSTDPHDATMGAMARQAAIARVLYVCFILIITFHLFG